MAWGDGVVTDDAHLVRDTRVDPLFAAAIEATEEAVVNSLIGVQGHDDEALPLARRQELPSPA